MNQSREVSLQKAGVEDAGVLTEMCRRAFDSEFGAPGPGGPPGYDSIEWNIKAIQKKWLQYRNILFVVEVVGGFIVGDRGSGYQVCERIWVDPENTRKGIATKAFELVWDQ